MNEEIVRLREEITMQINALKTLKTILTSIKTHCQHKQAKTFR
jgi:hypothetical protein